MLLVGHGLRLLVLCAVLLELELERIAMQQQNALLAPLIVGTARRFGKVARGHVRRAVARAAICCPPGTPHRPPPLFYALVLAAPGRLVVVHTYLVRRAACRWAAALLGAREPLPSRLAEFAGL